MYATLHHTVLVVVQVVAVLFVAWIVFAAHQGRMKRKHEAAQKILDKIDSEELLTLLRSEEGRLSIERILGTSRSPEEWSTDAVRRALLLLFGGPAFLVVYALGDFSGREMFLALGALAVGVGIGYLVAAALTRARSGRS